MKKARSTIVEASTEAEAFDIAPVLTRYIAEEESDAATARRLWRELVRFLMMVAHAGERGYGMFGPADALWHHFVLHTELYQAFCEKHAGRFLHHHPGGSLRGTVWRSGYLRFLIDYRGVFDAAPPDDIWPLPVVSSVALPETAADLRPRHVMAMERLERGVALKRGGRSVGGSDGGTGCGSGSLGFGSGHNVDDGDGSGCGGGCSG